MRFVTSGIRVRKTFKQVHQNNGQNWQKTKFKNVFERERERIVTY